MKKLRVVLEIDIDENEISKIKNHMDDYKNNITLEGWIEDFDVNRTGENNCVIKMCNPIHRYFNDNLDDSFVVIREAKIIKKELM